MRIPNPQGLNELPHIDIFRCAMGRLVRGDKNYVLTDVSERSVCARLACYLEAVAIWSGLKGYYADVENNRKQNGEIKTIRKGVDEIINVTCDLILHSRGEIAGRDNLIAIEMKKADRCKESIENDWKRLRALTMPICQDGTRQIFSFGGVAIPEHVCEYELGVFILLDVKHKRIKIQYFLHGNDVEETETIHL